MPAHNHTSISNEHGTPAYVAEKAAEVLGGIDLDPASDATFNTIIKARRFFTKDDEGLRQAWGTPERPTTVFLNPPGGLLDCNNRVVLRKTASREACTDTGDCGLPAWGHVHSGIESAPHVWWRKLLAEFDEGHVSEAIFIGFNLEQLQVMQVDGARGPLNFPLCFPKKRVDYLKQTPDGLKRGGQPPHASFVCLISRFTEWPAFAKAFASIGRCARPLAAE